MYFISDIESKGKYNPYHEEILNCECMIGRLIPGLRPAIWIKPSYDPDEWHEFTLSQLIAVKEMDGKLYLETENTYYTLTEIINETETLSGA